MQHVEGLIEDEVAHGVEPEPVEEVGDVGDMVVVDVVFNAVLELGDVGEDFGDVLVQCCMT